MWEPTLLTGSLGTDRRFEGADCNTRPRERQGNQERSWALCDPSRPIYICRHTERQVFDRGAGRMCVNSSKIAVWAAVLMAALPAVAAAPRPRAAADPLLPYLRGEDSLSRSRVLALLEEAGRPPCQA